MRRQGRARKHGVQGHHGRHQRGSAAVRARARAEAAKVRLSYVEEEANLRRQHAEREAKLKASLEVLQHQKESTAAIAEAEVLEGAVDGKSERHSCVLSIYSVPSETSRHTEQYVLEQRK